MAFIGAVKKLRTEKLLDPSPRQVWCQKNESYNEVHILIVYYSPRSGISHCQRLYVHFLCVVGVMSAVGIKIINKNMTLSDDFFFLIRAHLLYTQHLPGIKDLDGSIPCDIQRLCWGFPLLMLCGTEDRWWPLPASSDDLLCRNRAFSGLERGFLHVIHINALPLFKWLFSAVKTGSFESFICFYCTDFCQYIFFLLLKK